MSLIRYEPSGFLFFEHNNSAFNSNSRSRSELELSLQKLRKQQFPTGGERAGSI